jgi:hypothetical protein
MARLTSALALVVLAGALAGCGSGGGDKTLTKEEYAADVTQLCASNATELRKLVLSGGGNFLARKGDRFLATVDKSLATLKTLKPPRELEAKADQLVVHSQATRDLLVKVIHQAKKNPGSVNLGSSGLIDSRRKVIEAATAVGATC